MKKIEEQLNRPSTARLADYFVTIGVDDYHTEDEMREMPSIRNTQTVIQDDD